MLGHHDPTQFFNSPALDRAVQPNDDPFGPVESGFVHIPETAPWLDAYLHELTVFPKGKHDDQVDSTAQFLDWFKRPFSQPQVM